MKVLGVNLTKYDLDLLFKIGSKENVPWYDLVGSEKATIWFLHRSNLVVAVKDGWELSLKGFEVYDELRKQREYDKGN